METSHDQSTTTARASSAAGLTAGVVAGAAGIAVAELIASLSRQVQSPVLDVGDRVIDRVPAWLKNLAIDWFGTNDKIALLVGIGSILTVYAALCGLVAARVDRRLGYGAIGLFGVIGAWAALAARGGAPWWSVWPSVVGAAAAVGALHLLMTFAPRRPGDGAVPASALPDDDPGTAPSAQGSASAVIGVATHDRRRFLGASAALVVAAAVVGQTGRWLTSRFSAADSRAAVRLPTPAASLAPVAADTAFDVDGISPLFTPNGDFYRIDTALTVPQVPAETWSLRVTGMVDRTIELSYADLLGRDLMEADITMTCVSNEIGGGLVGTARWLGARLDDLLAEAGIDAAADQIVGRSSDGYTCGFPVSALDGRDALVAVAMNGEPLPLEHGFPARLIVPGLYGYVSATKWLTEIELTTFDSFDQYWVPRGWDAEAPIKTMSRIDTPGGLANLAPGTVPIAGVAWAQTRGIAAVEVQIDDGAWSPAELADAVNDDMWRQWRLAWDATPGRHTLRVRAIDGNGDVQTEERRPPMPDGASGHHQIVVLVADA
jgi:DMSO/TMAO reductase YedYZ molybdopterin-dependent catalytic subunit